MQKKVFSEEQIIHILKLQESRFLWLRFAIRKVLLTDFNKHFDRFLFIIFYQKLAILFWKNRKILQRTVLIERK
jgi:hypothetical protein